MTEVRVDAHEIEALARRLKEAGRGDLRKELLRGIRQASKPTVLAIKARARERLPSSGGLADRIARSSMGTRTRLGGKSVGVQIYARNAYNLRRINQGIVRHPVYGNRNAWVTQRVEPGWFDDPILERLDDVRDEIARVIEDVAAKLTAGL